MITAALILIGLSLHLLGILIIRRALSDPRL